MSGPNVLQPFRNRASGHHRRDKDHMTLPRVVEVSARWRAPQGPNAQHDTPTTLSAWLPTLPSIMPNDTP